LRDLIQKNIDPIAIRFLLLSTHYRAQFNFTFEGLESAKKAVERLRNFIRRLQTTDGQSCEGKVKKIIEVAKLNFCQALCDDLNVSVMFACLFDFVREINNFLDKNNVSKKEAKKIIEVMHRFDSVIGVIGKIESKSSLSKKLKALINQREEARKNKDWKKSDEIRNKLKNMGILIEDTPQGVKWHLKNN
jgi:cysteinyl-tRNA synthetase